MSREERRARREDKKMMRRLTAVAIAAMILFGWSVVQTIDTVKFIKYSRAERASYSHLIDENEKEL